MIEAYSWRVGKERKKNQKKKWGQKMMKESERRELVILPAYF